jgi:hypothetical protein
MLTTDLQLNTLMVPGLIATVGINPEIKNWSVQSSLDYQG